MKTIKQMWEHYQRFCVPPDASAEQVKQTHQAFMAGFMALFVIIDNIAAPEVPDSFSLKILSNLRAETEQYLKAKKAQAEAHRSTQR
jgi:hypothetical protein